MNLTTLLEQRSERGTPRGSANVWANAQPALRSPLPTQSRGSWTFRIALAVWLIGIAVAAVFALGEGDDLETATESDTPIESSEPLPAPILVEGFELDRTRRPLDPELDADDVFGEPLVQIGDATFFGNSEVETHVIFGDPIDPFNNSIVGLELFDDGGFRPWSLNADADDLSSILDTVAQRDGEWTISSDTGLVEIDRFSIDPRFLLDAGWQFDFSNDDEQVTLQAHTTTDAAPVSEWMWVALLVDDSSTSAQEVREVEVLGRSGIVLSTGDIEEPSDAVFWVEDGFAYRLGTSIEVGNRLVSESASDSVELLQVAEETEWVSVVRASGETSSGEIVRFGILSLLLVGLLGLIVAVVVKGYSRTAVVLVLTLVFSILWLFALGGSGGLSSGVIPIIVVGLGLAWWSQQMERAS